MLKLVTALKLASIAVGISAVIGAVIIYNSNLTWQDWPMQLILVAGGIGGIVFGLWANSTIKQEDLLYRTNSSRDIDDIILKEKALKEANTEKEHL